MLDVQATFETAIDAPGSIILLQEYNHRMLNEYAVAIAGLSVAASGITNAKGRAALTTAKDRLYAVAEVHRALQAPLTGVLEVTDYLEGVCGAASRALTFDYRLVLHCRSPAITLPAPRAWRIGLILIELLINAAKHGRHGGEIAVELRSCNHNLVCSVVNESCADSKRGTGAGQAIIDILADQIGGRLERHVHGTRIAVGLVVPVSNSIEQARAG
ncbi:sensor histidine kinase [Sphingomonas oligoaromativorans]|uniref:sensor histidine kinase n=1 Tax=Sphingomonas oligoaromativorans TaxID=575322 RepID=UPI001422889B|nr:sensor histidine kinase [Sphingomonas oligoaromativorans]NIJ34126.1 two-component sensor histidine kinase [Sphingomonas oligoaromativorans]